MKYLSKEDVKTTRVFDKPLYIPQLDAYVKIKKWSGKQRANMLVKLSELYPNDDLTERITVSAKDLPLLMDMMKTVVGQSVCGEDDELIFADDVELVEELDVDVLQFLFEESAKANGLLASSLTSEIKNSETTQSDNSISD